MTQGHVEVNQVKCSQIAAIIKNLRLRPEFCERKYLKVEAPRETLIRMHFFAVAICHHTYSLYHRNLDLYGWDFIEHVFAKLAKEKHPLLDTGFLAKARIKEIKTLLCQVFSTDNTSESCTLDRLEERAGLMKDAAVIITEKFADSLYGLFNKSEGLLLNNSKGLYEILPQFEAYADPQQKKSTFLIKLLIEAGLLNIHDPENFIPIMDYHMQRVLLRMGCVEIRNGDLRNKIISREQMPGDEPIRSACITAFRLIAAGSGQPVIKLNDFFWSLGRSCCNENMLCQSGTCEKSPCTFMQIVKIEDHSNCIFEIVCAGAKDESYRRLWQPVVQTHFY